jgi:hypothetical protein
MCLDYPPMLPPSQQRDLGARQRLARVRRAAMPSFCILSKHAEKRASLQPVVAIAETLRVRTRARRTLVCGTCSRFRGYGNYRE